jgi:hypothetical protein
MYRDFLSAVIIMDVWQEVSGRECVSQRINFCRSHKGQTFAAHRRTVEVNRPQISLQSGTWDITHMLSQLLSKACTEQSMN